MPKKGEEVLKEVFPISELRKNSKLLFGVEIEVFDGALHGTTYDEISKEEVQVKINEWLERECK